MAKFPGKKDGTGGGGGRKRNVPVPRSVKIVEPRCKVCMCIWRDDIDVALVSSAHSYSSVARQFQALGANEINRKNLKRHLDRHVSLRQQSIRRVIEEEAKRAAMSVDEAVGTMLTNRTVLRTVTIMGHDAIVTGKVVVEPRETMAAAAELRRQDAEFQHDALDEMMVQYRAFSKAVKEFVPEDMHAAMFARYEEILAIMRGEKGLEQIVTFDYTAEASDVDDPKLLEGGEDDDTPTDEVDP